MGFSRWDEDVEFKSQHEVRGIKQANEILGLGWLNDDIEVTTVGEAKLLKRANEILRF